MKLFQTLFMAFFTAFPTLAHAQIAPERFIVSVDLLDKGTKIFSPRIIMPVGGTASARKADAYEFIVSLPEPRVSEASSFVTHVVLKRSVQSSWVELMATDVSLSLGKSITLKAPSSPGVADGPGQALTLRISVDRFVKEAASVASRKSPFA